MSRTVIHAFLAVILLLAASPLRVLCYDSCVSDAKVVRPSGHDRPPCHEPHATAPPRHSDPADDGCRHGDESPAPSLRPAHKRVDASTDTQALVHVVPDRIHDVWLMPSRLGAANPLLHVALAPVCFLTPLRI